MRTQEEKWFKKEARIITEMFDEKLANGIKPESGLKDDEWDGLCHQSAEHLSPFSLKKRKQLIKFIAETYKINLKLEQQEISIENSSGNSRTIYFCEYYPTKFAGTISQRNLADMDSDYFRKKIGQIMAAIPGGFKAFEEIAEKTPYIFN